MNRYEIEVEVTFTKTFEIYADNRDDAESEADEMLDDVTAFDIYQENDWDIGKDITTITIC